MSIALDKQSIQNGYVPASGDRVRVTRTDPNGKIKFVKTGVVGLCVRGDYFEFTEDIDSSNPGRHVYVTSDRAVELHMPRWSQTTTRI